MVKSGVMRSCLVWFGLLSLVLVWSGNLAQDDLDSEYLHQV